MGEAILMTDLSNAGKNIIYWLEKECGIQIIGPWIREEAIAFAADRYMFTIRKLEEKKCCFDYYLLMYPRYPLQDYFRPDRLQEIKELLERNFIQAKWFDKEYNFLATIDSYFIRKKIYRFPRESYDELENYEAFCGSPRSFFENAAQEYFRSIGVIDQTKDSKNQSNNFWDEIPDEEERKIIDLYLKKDKFNNPLLTVIIIAGKIPCSPKHIYDICKKWRNVFGEEKIPPRDENPKMVIESESK